MTTSLTGKHRLHLSQGRRGISTDCDPRFMKQRKFSELGEIIGAEMKETHTVIEKWPYRLKLRPDQPGGQEEFDRQLSGGMSSMQRYVEWKRTAMYQDEMDGQEVD
jgi:hypothetical protein